MKIKIITLLLTLIPSLSLFGCGGETEAEKKAKEIECFQKAMLEKIAGRPAKEDCK